MKRTLLALSCTLIFAAGTASAAGNEPTMTDKAKQAAQTIGEKAKEAAEKVKDMAQETAQRAKTAGDDKPDRTADSARSSESQRLQKQADADLKAARQKCDSIQRAADKNVCEKTAAVAYANAELRIAKAEAAAERNKTSSMGAGKAAR